MRTFFLVITLVFVSTLIHCIETESAADVNQDRIWSEYLTTFNLTRNKTTAWVQFKFGSTSLKLTERPFFGDYQLSRNSDLVVGSYYSREISGTSSQSYEWIDAEGTTYMNAVTPYTFQLTNPPLQLSKNTYYQFDWTGLAIPDQAGTFHITATNEAGFPTASFTSGDLIEIEPGDLNLLESGNARITITRTYSDPVEESTAEGGESTISVIREYDVVIVE